MSIALALHVLFVVIWVGGMFFAYMALRPAAMNILEPPLRLTLWKAVFAKFFPWVWLSVITILATGYWMLLVPFGGFANAPIFVHIMHALGIIMVLIYLHLFFAPYQRLTRAVDTQDWPVGGKMLGQIRILIAINLSIGLLTVLIATAGKFMI
jgi:uncharacterized membrane protein